MMTPQRLTFAVACACFLVTLGLRLPQPQPQQSKTGAYRVGLVFDVGGLGDKSFNDGAYAGIERARRELGIDATTIEPGDGSDRAAALRMLAASAVSTVIGVGFIFTDDILQVAADYPEVVFVCIDMALRPDPDGKFVPKNVVALKFREEQGSFLAGVLAASLSKSGKIGFVGGMDIPLIHKFSAGFRAGIAAQCPHCRLSVLFAGATANAFKDPGKGREMALAQYESGVDIIYHAAGATGLGVFQAARERHAMAIGVDSDQSAEGPEVVVSSMVKRIDRAVFDTIQAARAHTLVPGVLSLGLKEDAIELVRNERFFTQAIDARLAEFRAALVAGAIEVPDHD